MEILLINCYNISVEDLNDLTALFRLYKLDYSLKKYKLKVEKFSSLDKQVQFDIQDAVAGYTNEFQIAKVNKA